MIRTIERKALISKQTHKNLEEALKHFTWLYNKNLEERKTHYENTGKTLSCYDQQKNLTFLRSKNEYVEKFNRRPQVHILRRLDNTYKKFFRDKLYNQGKGFPRFKSFNRGIRSFDNGDHIPKIKQKGNKYSLSIAGLGVFKFGKKLPEGIIKLIRVVKTPRRVKLQFVVEIEDLIKQPQDSPIGIDMGVSNLVTTSNNIQIPGIKINESRKKRLQRKASKAKKSSNNRKKKWLLYRKEEQRISERKRGMIHELTSSLIKENNTYIIEDLNIQNMIKKKKGKNTLHKNILNSRWGYFKDFLTYKAESAGGKVIKVNPAYTSKRCSRCGVVKEKLALYERTYKCDCGLVLDRDLNAAINILQKGLINLNSGGNSPERGKNILIKKAPLLTA